MTAKPATLTLSARPPYDQGKLVPFWLVHVAALFGCALWWLGTIPVSPATLILAAIYFCISSTSITAGYHRLFSHPTYKARWPLKLFYLLFGAAAVQGSAIQWSAQHRDHHTFCDKNGDPYNIKMGFWYAHWGWVMRKTFPNYKRVKDLEKNRLLILQYKVYLPLAIGNAFILPAIIGWVFWGEAWSSLFIAGFLRVVIQWHMTFCVNSVAHYFGSQKYTIKYSARGSWWLSFVTWGEMDHNFHHAYPNDFRTGARWWDFDPSKLFIWICSKIGLASELKRTDANKILQP